ncbi:glycosyltransferase [Arthrobacter sp. Cr_A7]|uniref:glycosyltransferase n=1 Tax=Arthrobacter sp. Cr_A7 TaxID=3031017 RepID=UPI0023DB0C94|nr:glycosyltransferase [Arthrobacter sp. Cr_A7]MDF2048844.1 glycosyltransferase [Arthrobacter sp. Cr_A7]
MDVAEIRAVADWSSVLSSDEQAAYDALPPKFILGASRFVSYKRLDIVIRAGEVAGLPVVLAGGGPDEALINSLAASAKVDVTVLSRPSTQLLRALYQKALLYVFPPVEDFGIMPVEAMAAGTPVLANRVGGASETVTEGKTGALFDADDEASLLSGLNRALSLDTAGISDHALPFSRDRFQNEIRAWVAEHSAVKAPHPGHTFK